MKINHPSPPRHSQTSGASGSAAPDALSAQSSDAIDRDLLTAWDQWQTCATEPEGRALAFTRLRECVQNRHTCLDLSCLGLTTLPDRWPDHITELFLAQNLLTGLPDSLPASLQELDISDNQFRALPGTLPDKLGCINALRNRLEVLPDVLPASLIALTLAHNQLEQLPEHLPRRMEYLDVGFNELTHLPEDLPPDLDTLIAPENHLTSLPAVLPEHLSLLAVEENQITFIPDNLPAELNVLTISYNRLTSLPETLPDYLMYLDVKQNQIACLPDHLPACLVELRAGNNRLTHVPLNWPARVAHILLNNNQITALPEHIFDSLHGAHLALEDNPLSERTRVGIGLENARAPREIGGVITFSMSNGEPAAVALPVEQAVACWYREDQRAEIVAKWQDIAAEPASDAFSAFLARLRNSVNLRDPAFEHAVGDWLSSLPHNPVLRATTFALALDASASCEDRAVLALNSMQITRISHDVLQGKYDNRISDLVQCARRVFRHECLESIAREKVKQLRFADEIEVYLAFQVKLNDALQLDSLARNMRFFDMAGVTSDDVATSLQAVQMRENMEFTAWLATWAPWEQMLEREDKSGFDAARGRLHQQLEISLKNDLPAVLGQTGLEGDADATREAGAAISNRLQRQIKIPLTEGFLAARGQTHLLDHVWHVHGMQ